jgi:zinc protease
MPILAKAFDGWKAEKPYARIEQAFQADLKPERVTILTPDKENAIYLAALSVPIKDDNPDYPALLVGNFILGGGGLSSRIANRLRQKDGLSYGAGSNFSASPLDQKAELIVNAIYNPANVAKVVSGVDEELERLLGDGVTTAELDGAKNGYLQQQQNQRTNDAAVTATLAQNLHLGRTMQFQADLEQKIKDLTPEAVNTALRKYLDPKRFSVVTAGDFKKK